MKRFDFAATLRDLGSEPVRVSLARRALHVWPLALILAACDSGIPARPLPALGACEYTVTYEDGEVERYEHRAYALRSRSRSGLFCDAEGDGFPLAVPRFELGNGGFFSAPIGEPFKEDAAFLKTDIPALLYGEGQGKGVVVDVRTESEVGGRFRYRLERIESSRNPPKITVEGAFRVRIPSE